MNNKNFSSLLDSLKNIIGTKQLNSSNIIDMCRMLMQLVEKFPKLPGSQKKDLVIGVLTYYVKEELGADSPILKIIDEVDDILLFVQCIYFPSIRI